MSTHRHILKGCSPTPLAHYLKALGILRLVAEQKDPNCRGAWRDEQFELATRLSEEELERFFLEEYRPTAMLSPWNGASGFFRTWDEKKKVLRNSKNGEALDTLIRSSEPRFSDIRQGHARAVRLLAEFAQVVDVAELSKKDLQRLLIVPSGDGSKYPVIDKDEGKEAVQRAMIAGNESNPFYASAIVDGGAAISYPSLWGSGGNDGAMDFTARFFENIIQALITNSRACSKELLTASLFAVAGAGMLTGSAGKTGQFNPAAAGGPNCTNGTGGQDATYLNPWDFVLSLEGAVLFTSSITRRASTSSQARSSAPFALRSLALGASTLSKDEEGTSRGEQWMPLWHRFATVAEVALLMKEGRAQLGRAMAAQPVDMARAIARLGVARGIQSFQRYAYLQRNGRSIYAVPLRRIAVRESPWAQLVDDLVVWMERLMRAAGDAAPARLQQAERRLSDAVFSALTHDDNPTLWQDVLIAAAQVEAIQATGIATRVGPIRELRGEWALACDDHSPEFRLAVALAGAFAPYSADGKRGGSVRHHFLPLKARVSAYLMSDDRLLNDPRVVANGRDPLLDVIAVVERRAVEAQQDGRRQPQILPAIGAHLQDLAAWLDGSVDVSRCVDLARAMMAIKHEHWGRVRKRLYRPSVESEPDEAWKVLRLCCLPYAIDGDRSIPLDPEILRRLTSGDVENAFLLARHRLRAHGVVPSLEHVIIDTSVAKRWASALAFPITKSTAKRILRNVDPAASKEEDHEYPA